MNRLRIFAGLLAAVGVGGPAAAQTPDSAFLANFRWRSVGPANMSGRVTDVRGLPSPSRTFFVQTAAGGIFKTTNGGTTFRAVFQNERCVAGGNMAIAPSDSMVVYVGTGEPNSRNTISPGCGMYKSTDGGLTYRPIGLPESGHIGRVVVHPTNPNVVWVAALGHAWGPNKERGLFKTTDGGTTWTNVKYISDKAGFVDIAMDPTNPDVLFASSYERARGAYFLQSGGPGSALWKTTDGGSTWTEVKGGGFPETMKGRIGLAIAPSNNKVIYALVEADTMPNPKPEKGKPAQKSPSGLYRSTDGGGTWTKMADNNVRPFYYSQVRVDIKNPDRVYWSSTPVNFSDDGGKTVRQATQGIHVDHHAMWLDPADENHFITGNDGGIGQTWDKGGNYDFINTIAIGQPYAVSYDMQVPYHVCAGFQDNGSWCGPSRRRQGPVTNAMWSTYNGGDGFYTAQDPTDPNIRYGESQGGNIGRYLWSTGERTALQKPNWRSKVSAWNDSVLAARPDTTKPATPAEKKRLADIATARAADSAATDLRWNWNTPFFLSPHNPTVIYMGANRVMKSVKRGDEMFAISPDLTKADTMKIRISTQTTGGITTDATGAETYGTIVTLAESPIRPGLLYAGTDDGNVWLTRNDGGQWENLTGRFPGVPAGTYVSRIEPSPTDSAAFYVTFDGHRMQDFTPYVYLTTDFGKTFRSIAANLPTGGPDFVHVIREDSRNKNLLFLGTDVGAYVSFDRGGSWQRFMTGLPTVPVHDLQIHSRDRDLIAATHGRSIWIVNISELEQVTPAVLAASTYLFDPGTARQWGEAPVNGESAGHKIFEAQSPQYGAEITYKLSSGTPRDRVSIAILDVKGDTVRTLSGPGGAGIHRVSWDFRGPPPRREPLGPSARRDSIQLAERAKVVFDSLAQAGTLARPMADRIKNAMVTGDTQELGQILGFGGGGGGGGGGRFGGGAPQGFNERPGESAPPRAGGRGPGGQAGPGGAGGPGAGGTIDQELMGTIADLLRPGAGGGRRGLFGLFGGGGRGGAGGATTMGPGQYLVVMTVGGQTFRQTLTVERASGTGAAGGFFEEEEDGREP
ncbi:MAG: hypothetical protein AB7S39_16425 [Gemmatimonadales bacterium]